jgi:hypothetical protein
MPNPSRLFNVNNGKCISVREHHRTCFNLKFSRRCTRQTSVNHLLTNCTGLHGCNLCPNATTQLILKADHCFLLFLFYSSPVCFIIRVSLFSFRHDALYNYAYKFERFFRVCLQFVIHSYFEYI